MSGLAVSGHQGSVHGRKDAETQVLAVPHKTLDVVSTARRANPYQ